MFDLPPELVAAIADAAADDTPRLVAADWLDEHDDPDAARLIRAQCRLAAEPKPPAEELRTLRAGVKEVRARNLDRWLGPLAALARRDPSQTSFRRGFVAKVSTREPFTLDMLRAAARLPLLEGLYAPSTRGIGLDDLACLAGLPLLREVRLDAIDYGAPSAATLAALARTPRLQVLEAGAFRWSGEERRAFLDASVAWLDGLPEAERGAAVRGLLGMRDDETAVVVGHQSGGFPNTPPHQLELAARLPGLDKLSVIHVHPEGRAIPAGSFAGLRWLSVTGEFVPLAAALHDATSVEAAEFAGIGWANRPAIFEWLSRQRRLASLLLPSEFAGAFDPPVLRTLREFSVSGTDAGSLDLAKRWARLQPALGRVSLGPHHFRVDRSSGIPRLVALAPG